MEDVHSSPLALNIFAVMNASSHTVDIFTVVFCCPSCKTEYNGLNY